MNLRELMQLESSHINDERNFAMSLLNIIQTDKTSACRCEMCAALHSAALHWNHLPVSRRFSAKKQQRSEFKNLAPSQPRKKLFQNHMYHTQGIG
jgi:hypothetical protein